MMTRAEEAPSRARRFALALAARPLTALMPAPGNGHTHEGTVTPRSMAKGRLAGGDQALNGLNFISEATLNVLEPGSCREITAGAKK